MRRTALIIMTAGFLFLLDTASITVAGIDLLLDPVGFLLIFNAVRPLKKYGDRFGPCIPLSLALVALSAVQLFLTAGLAAAVVAALRYAGQGALLLCLALGLAALPGVRRSRAKTIALWAVAAVNALACLAMAVLFPAYLLAAGTGYSLAGWPAGALLAAQLALPALLLWLAFTQSDERPTAGI